MEEFDRGIPSSSDHTGSHFRLVRGEPQLKGAVEHRLKVEGDELCLYHCVAASLNVAYYTALSLESRIEAAYYIKSRFLIFLRGKGRTDDANRLAGTGPLSYPTDNDFHMLSACLGGPVLLSDEGGGDLAAVHIGEIGSL